MPILEPSQLPGTNEVMEPTISTLKLRQLRPTIKAREWQSISYNYAYLHLKHILFMVIHSKSADTY